MEHDGELVQAHTRSPRRYPITYPSLLSLVIVVQVVEPEAPVTNVEDWEQYVDDGGYVIEGEEYIEPTV